MLGLPRKGKAVGTHQHALVSSGAKRVAWDWLLRVLDRRGSRIKTWAESLSIWEHSPVIQDFRGNWAVKKGPEEQAVPCHSHSCWAVALPTLEAITGGARAQRPDTSTVGGFKASSGFSVLQRKLLRQPQDHARTLVCVLKGWGPSADLQAFHNKQCPVGGDF